MRRSEYASAVDAWVAVLLVAALGVCLYAASRLLQAGSVVWAASLVLFPAGLGLVLMPVRYTIAAPDLVIRSGVWKVGVPLRAIRRVCPSSSLLASPALSMRRLAIEYHSGPHSRPTIYISPTDRDGFLNDLADAAGLERRGEELVRVAETSAR